MKTKKKEPNPVAAVFIVVIAVFVLMIAWSMSGGKNGKEKQEKAKQEKTKQESGKQESGKQEKNKQENKKQNERGRQATAVRVTKAELGNVENTIIVNGDVLSVKEVSIFPVTGGKITELRLKIGDTVQVGQIIAMIDPSRPGEVYAKSPVRSTIRGTILSAPFNAGDTINTSQAIYVVGDLSSLVVETFVPERFSSSVKRGQNAEIFFDFLSGDMSGLSWTGIVSEVSPVIDPKSRTLKTQLRFLKPDTRIKSGMFATIRLVTESRTNVLVIPRNAVINTYGSWVVFIVRDNVAQRKTVMLGLESDTTVEIISGIAEGDLVVIAGQNFLSNDEAVRIVD
jgi:multidrug efflux pump subunit AcrA (membrane-fusion protein)